ncbi:MAG: class I SAM-dependent methyltransferase [Nanoarchaeota archaeon]|nr:class I SAM-dependent methyltransferase [Nanoarchaeota archaeon]
MNPNSLTIKTYNLIAKEYSEKVKGLVPLEELEKFANYVEGKNILDIGCGSGVAAKELQERGFNVFGIDLSRKLINESQKTSPSSTFEEMDMRNLLFEDKYFDGIWHVASLLHLEKKDAPMALSEAYRVLKKNGIMYLSIKMGEGERLEKDGRYGGLKKYYAYYREEEMNSILENIGFKVLENYSISYKDNYRIAHPWINIFAKK